MHVITCKEIYIYCYFSVKQIIVIALKGIAVGAAPAWILLKFVQQVDIDARLNFPKDYFLKKIFMGVVRVLYEG